MISWHDDLKLNNYHISHTGVTQGMTTTVSGCHKQLGPLLALLGKLLVLTVDPALVPALGLVRDLSSTLTLGLSGSKTPFIWNSSPRSQRGLPV